MPYLIHIAILFFIYAILGVSLNLVVGYAGLLSVAHAAFYGIGAYVTAIALTQYGINFFVSVLLGMLLSGIVSLLVGMVFSKFRDDYYALASLGFNVIVFSIFLNWESMTKGPLGIPGVGKPTVFGYEIASNGTFLLLAIALFALVYMVATKIDGSSFGRVLKAIREDEQALEVFGYRVEYFKLAIFVIGAAMASVAGSLFASYITYVDPSSFSLNESIFILAIVIMGGLGSIRGTLAGALFLVLLPEALRFVGLPTDIAAQSRQVIYGAILVLLMVYRPRGFVGEYELK
ncbi:TPA: branched-chain amino acid ABC transporter permease [Candidatus Wolfebacteria bacterium]|uniref:Amino acid/amide ABC transporter membrane protein 2, HAAT family n=2 Tax=Candidatus Wolfeibacteriota TaxID=1752735 RepID=A0A0G1U8E3_9BACT|nr:MAG: amino acid ABC transporter, branched-chain amino acid transport system permease protein [Candidatus Wolfebacteria bacterium GW2011_GWB1_47_1]KKU59736.1 MAG: Amino acid/amide ABC transporter membrane protein 2, HAAT family [Candidatus Wolfebacteria bacterium GW2011_GWE2_47_12]KKU65727.1 MAG: Amino acid/amide ABC transporter membrane protein 2, HAAT family [Candidatus Wolfebacteria bacterium GW2011_GWD2_47_17]KKU76735.1 MAG: Amino acid/amide ABC transporter membrane protein 2, HAAT family 